MNLHAEIIARWRAYRPHMSVSELARRSGVTRANVSMALAGKTEPNGATLSALATALGMRKVKWKKIRPVKLKPLYRSKNDGRTTSQHEPTADLQHAVDGGSPQSAP